MVGEQVGPRSFRLNDPAATITAAQELYVTGTVRTFGLAEVEQELGFDLQDDMFADWGGRTVILADTLTPASQ